MANRKPLLTFLTSVFIGIALTGNADAHNVNLASFKINQSTNITSTSMPLIDAESSWTLTVDTALHNLHQSLLKTNEEEHLINDGVYNRKLAIEYLKNNTHITVNGAKKPVQLESVNASIGNHQSIFVFRVLNPPVKITSFDLYIPAMSDNLNQMNLVKVIGDRWNTHIVLSKKNNFQSELKPKP